MDCPTCEKSLSTERGMRQHHTKVHGDPLPNRTCKGCGTEFYDEKARLKYCDDCNPSAGEHNGNWKDAKETAECKLCGDEFEYYPSDKKGVFCPTCVAESDEFLGDPYVKDARRIRKSCEQCGDTMVVLVSDRRRERGRFCCEECLWKWMMDEYGGDGERIYNGNWRSVKRQALDRDDHSCQICGITKEAIGQEPDVHHIQPVRTFDDPREAHTIDNVICLCKQCHIQAERGMIPTPEPK